MDSFPFLHLPSLPTSLNSAPYSCLRTCIKSHDTLVHHPLPLSYKLIAKSSASSTRQRMTWPLLLSHSLSRPSRYPELPCFLVTSFRTSSVPSLTAFTLAESCAWTSLPSNRYQFGSFLQSDFRPNALPSRKTSLTLTSISQTTSSVSPVILQHIILAITLHSSYHTCDTSLSLLSLLSPLPFCMWAPQELCPQQLNYDWNILGTQWVSAGWNNADECFLAWLTSFSELDMTSYSWLLLKFISTTLNYSKFFFF